MRQCNCGYGGYHEPENPLCELNQAPTAAEASRAVRVDSAYVAAAAELKAADALADIVAHEITQLPDDSETADALREALADYREARNAQ